MLTKHNSTNETQNTAHQEPRHVISASRQGSSVDEDEKGNEDDKRQQPDRRLHRVVTPGKLKIGWNVVDRDETGRVEGRRQHEK